MRSKQEKGLKFCPLMMIKPVVVISTGAFAGKIFKAKKMEDICDMKFESLYVNVSMR